MVFHIRMLLNDSSDALNDSITKSCKSYCDPIENREGFCPDWCISRCFPICNRPLLYDTLSPPPLEFLSDSNDHHSERSYRVSVFLTITLAILATTFFIFSCYTVYKFCVDRYNSRRQPPQQPQEEEAYEDFLDEDHGPVGIDHPIWYIRTVGLQPSVISAITVCKYKKGDGLLEGTECSVCLNEFQEDETLRLLPKCNHAFHIPCIDTWLGSHTNCPICRAGILINSPSLHSPELSNRNLGRADEFQVEISEYQSESGIGRERGGEPSQVSIDAEDEEESQAQNALRRNEDFGEDDQGNTKGREGDGIQPLRRSFSMDSLSASMVSTAIADALSANSETNLGKRCKQISESNMGVAAKRPDDQNLVGSCSIEKSRQKGPSLVKRSLSCGAKVFLSRHIRSRSSILPS